MTATCKSCGASLIWALTVNGRRIPLDATPERRFVLPAGIRPDDDPPPTAEQIATYQTHFATCPDAAEHRRAGSERGPVK